MLKFTGKLMPEAKQRAVSLRLIAFFTTDEDRFTFFVALGRKSGNLVKRSGRKIDTLRPQRRKRDYRSAGLPESTYPENLCQFKNEVFVS